MFLQWVVPVSYRRRWIHLSISLSQLSDISKQPADLQCSSAAKCLHTKRNAKAWCRIMNTMSYTLYVPADLIQWLIEISIHKTRDDHWGHMLYVLWKGLGLNNLNSNMIHFLSLYTKKIIILLISRCTTVLVSYV